MISAFTGTASPTVSVIMPAYCVTEYIPDALESLFAQTVDDFEVIIVNDGCPDTANLERALAPYRERIHYIRQDNAGVAAARNTAIRAAHGEFIAQLDPDDIWEAKHLETQLQVFRSDPTVDVVYPNMTLFGETPHAGRTFMDLYPSQGEVTIGSILSRTCIPTYAVIARRSTLLSTGLFDPELDRGEDLDLWIRVLNSGGRIVWNSDPTVRYRCRPNSLTSDPVRTSECMVAVLAKLQRTAALSETDRACLANALSRETAWLDFARGKRALFDGDITAARQQLTRANEYFRSRKMDLILFLLRWAPSLVRWAAQLRHKGNAFAS